MKNKKRTGFIIAGTTAVTALVAAGVVIYANAAIKVESFKVSKDDVSQVLELNGTVQSDKTQSMFAGVDAKVDKVYVKVGDTVKKGDLLVSFDEERIEYLKTLAEYEAEAAAGSYQNSIEMGNRTQSLYNEANSTIVILDQKIADTQNLILALQKQISDRKASFAGEGAALQKSIIDTTGKIADSTESATGNANTDDYQKELSNLQKLAQGNAYNQQYDSEILNMQNELNRLTADLANYKEYKAQLTSQKASAETARLTAGQKEQLEAIKAQSELTTEETLKNLELAKDGIRAEFDGIVTELNVEEGAEIARGMNLVTIASSNDIIVKCSVNKYDILSIEEGQTTSSRIGNTDYTGTVTRIEKITGADAGATPGVGVEVKLDNPDDAIILGLDTKTKVNVAAVEDTLCIPKSAALEEDGKTYVFVEKDKKAVKKTIETGVKNDDMIEVKSGLNEGEVVVWNEEAEIKNGMDIRVSQ